MGGKVDDSLVRDMSFFLMISEMRLVEDSLAYLDRVQISARFKDILGSCAGTIGLGYSYILQLVRHSGNDKS